MLHTDFDPNRTAVINPAEIIPKLETMPENCIGVFSHRIVDEYVRRLLPRDAGQGGKAAF